MSEIQVVVFNLCSEICGVDTTLIKQILKCESIRKIDNAPDYLLGAIELRGQFYPIIDMNKRFNIGQTDINGRTKILITEIEGYNIGFAVDDVSGLIKLSKDDIESIPELAKNSGNSYVKTVAKDGDRIISIIDLNDVLDENELVQVFKTVKSVDEAAAAL